MYDILDEKFMPWWSRIVKCRNQYQSFSDWWNGRWKCPQCHRAYEKYSQGLHDMTLVFIKDGKVVERRLECSACGFNEIVWSDEYGRSR